MWWVADPAATPRTVVIVVFDGVKLLDAAGPAEVFAEANRFGAEYRLTGRVRGRRGRHDFHRNQICCH